MRFVAVVKSLLNEWPAVGLTPRRGERGQVGRYLGGEWGDSLVYIREPSCWRNCGEKKKEAALFLRSLAKTKKWTIKMSSKGCSAFESRASLWLGPWVRRRHFLWRRKMAGTPGTRRKGTRRGPRFRTDIGSLCLSAVQTSIRLTWWRRGSLARPRDIEARDRRAYDPLGLRIGRAGECDP